MRYADVETHCLSLPGATLHVQWGDTRVFKVGGKMFAMIPMDGERAEGVWFKAGEASAQILTQIDGIRPCPISRARIGWRWTASGR